jgi:hypothetical protein
MAIDGLPINLEDLGRSLQLFEAAVKIPFEDRHSLGARYTPGTKP